MSMKMDGNLTDDDRDRQLPLPLEYPPVIMTQWGPVTESARAQAAINMKADPALRAKVEEMIGVDKAKNNYPEAYV